MRTVIVAMLVVMVGPGGCSRETKAAPERKPRSEALAVASNAAVAHPAASIAGFVPPGWRIEDQQEGDLNGDRLPDIALILAGTDRNLISDKNQDGLPDDDNPRRLLVLFRNADGTFQKKLDNQSFLPVSEAAGLYGPSGTNLKIIAGTMKFSIGVLEEPENTFTFRYENGDFKLIGYDGHSRHRASGNVADLSINYSTARATTSAWKVTGSEDSIDREIKLPKRPLLNFDQVGPADDFQPPIAFPDYLDP